MVKVVYNDKLVYKVVILVVFGDTFMKRDGSSKWYFDIHELTTAMYYWLPSTNSAVLSLFI